MHNSLSSSAILRTVVPRLDDPVAFVANAYAVINRYERKHGPVVLCIGTSPGSKGRRPNYRINDAATGDLVVVIDGNTHKPWPDKASEFAGDWSTDFTQVRQLLVELREQERSQLRK